VVAATGGSEGGGGARSGRTSPRNTNNGDSAAEGADDVTAAQRALSARDHARLTLLLALQQVRSE
jgi:hypothetical protein